jgi:carboxymethylenebutenolidase
MRIETRAITFDSGSEKIIGFLALPLSAGRHAAVIAIHEWWGLNDWVKKQAANLATNGYIVLAVDLYRGKLAMEAYVARRLKRGLPHGRAMGDLKAAFNYLAARCDVDSRHIGAIGWSMGGCFALQLAIYQPLLAACVVNYGKLPTDPADIQKINGAVLGHFGAVDRGIPPKRIRTFEKMMRDLKKPVHLKIYVGAGHGFENFDDPRRYRPLAAADAWSRTLAFLAKVMSKRISSGTTDETKAQIGLTGSLALPRRHPVRQRRRTYR